MDWKYFGVSNDETGIGEYYGNAVCLAVYVRRRNYDGCRDMSSGVRARASKTTTRNRRAKTQSTALPASRLRKASIGGIISDEKQGTHREDFLPVKRTGRKQKNDGGPSDRGTSAGERFRAETAATSKPRNHKRA